MTEFRIVTNGEKYRLQARARHCFFGFRWWSAWGDLGGYHLGPWWTVKDYDALDDAVDALVKSRSRAAADARGWCPVDVVLEGDR